MSEKSFDILITGAGAVGLATAYQLLSQRPDLKVAVVDKEKEVAAHQTGHNSGVIHSGIYYKPGSLKALNCRKGYEALIRFCEENGVRYELCGKVIVATQDEEIPRLNGIYERGLANGMQGLRKISSAEVKEIEPHVSSKAGIWVPQTGIIHYKEVAEKYAEKVIEKGGRLFLGQKVERIQSLAGETVVSADGAEYKTKVLVNCAGLYADKLAEAGGSRPELKIIPFRGEYYQLVKEKEYLVRNLIYPVPDPNFPFLGVHFTRMIRGGIEAGPNAVLAFRREGYSRWQADFKELFDIVSYTGFQKIARRLWRQGLDELHRSYFKSAFVHTLQRLIPEIRSEDLVPGGAGVRAQALDRDGMLVDDFLVDVHGRIVNVLNAPSPAATASLAVGEMVAARTLAFF